MKYITRAALLFMAFGFISAHAHTDTQKTASLGMGHICSLAGRVPTNSGIFMEAATDYRPQ